MSALVDMVLLLGLAAGPDDPDPRSGLGLESEALEDLARRIAVDPDKVEKRERRQQEDPRPQRPETSLQPVEPKSADWIDFDWLELQAGAGMAMFSKVFHIRPSPCFAIAGHAPVPLLSPADNPDGDYFGAYAELDVAMIKRTIQPSVAKPSGALLALTVGADYTILRNSTWLLLVRAGFQYATYSGVTDLKDGIAPVAGLTAGLSISRSVTITLTPEYILGKKDSIILGTVGVTIDF
jgi:hypothetical protein